MLEVTTTRPRRGLVAALITALIAALGVAAAMFAVATPAAAATIPPSTTVVPSPPSAPNSNATKTKVATCPAGLRVIGGGSRIIGPADHVILIQEEPRSSRGVDTYVVTAVEDTVGTAANWTVEATAICSPPIAGLTLVSAVGPDQGSGFGNATASCPAGTNALSAGGRINGGQNLVALSTHVEGGALFTNRTTAAGFYTSSAPQGWTVTAVTACATVPFLDTEVVRADEVSTNGVDLTLNATCPAGKKVTGGSGWVPTGGVITSVNVDTARSRIQVIARRNLPGGTDFGLVTAKAICIA